MPMSRDLKHSRFCIFRGYSYTKYGPHLNPTKNNSVLGDPAVSLVSLIGVIHLLNVDLTLIPTKNNSVLGHRAVSLVSLSFSSHWLNSKAWLMQNLIYFQEDINQALMKLVKKLKVISVRSQLYP